MSSNPSFAHNSHDSLPQSCKKDSNESSTDHQRQQELEYDGLLTAASNSSPRKNCCTWKVAAVFLVFVAGALVLTWQMLPAENVVVKYIPTFPEPSNPYQGPEAGAPSSGGEAQNDGGGGGITIGVPPSQTPSDDEVVGIITPSFMMCPEGGGLCCNGSPNNCQLRVDEMMFGMVHNSMSTEEGGFLFGYNHQFGLEKALVAGYRGLSLDVCNCNGVLQFCHNVCDLGERMPNEVFRNTVQFLNDNPSEVIVLLFEASKEKGPIVWNDLFAEMANVDGFVDMIYDHTYGDEWPMMSKLVRQNKRIIVFYFNGGT
ncbi:hypothetical protein ACHAXR_000902, partial [Thalassiosira sp. AJA248-18]